MMTSMADSGDVQTCVLVYLCVGHDTLKECIPREVAVQWFTAYIELLRRFEMHVQATQVSRVAK